MCHAHGDDGQLVQLEAEPVQLELDDVGVVELLVIVEDE